MFTGIIADVGTIADIRERDGGLSLRIDTNQLGLEDVKLGDSIAVNGVCLTAVKIEGKSFTVDVSRETLNCTVGLEQKGAGVNLEKALRLADRLGGHLVSGHVDGVGEVMDFVNLGESWKLVVHAPHELSKYIAAKGSVTINGVSLTVNKIEGTAFEVNLIPHTLQQTTLKELHIDSRVNLEIDLIARYVERMMSAEV
jgi:riboflavin synthase